MNKLPEIDNFQYLFQNDIPLIDTRAPVEFERGAFPNSLNIPLMNNKERRLVGVDYQDNGRNSAIKLGHRLVSGDIKKNRMDAWLDFVEKHPNGALYCFRGGLRSEIAQHWIFESSGITYPRVKGGFKDMRNYLTKKLDQIIELTNFMILGGQTGRGINASFAVHQDFTGQARERCIATAFAIGSGHLFETTFEKEVHSDLTGERCVLMGLLQGAFLAQYEVLREHGHSPSEAYNETIEEALQSLYPLISERGMDWMYANCSTTAQRGALDWAPKFRDTLKPVIEDCYQKVISGEEAKIAINSNSKSDYRQQLDKELNDVNNQEMWVAGKVLRQLRPENL